jgi:hypothetical protein
MEDKEEIQISKKYFKEIADLCYEIDNDILQDTTAALEKDVRKAKSPGEIRNAIEEILVVLEEVNGDENYQEIINQINDLVIQLDEEFL